MDQITNTGPRIPYSPRWSAERRRKRRASLRMPKFWVSTIFPAFLTTHRVSHTPPLLVSDATIGGCIRNLSKRTPWRYHESDGNTDPPSDTDSKYATGANCPSCSTRLLSLSLIYRIDAPPPYRRPHHHHHHQGDGENTYEHNPNPWTELTSETWTDPEAEPQTEWQSASTSKDPEGPTTPPDYPSTPTSPPASDSAPVAGPSGASNVNSNTVYGPSSSRGSNGTPPPSPHTISTKPTSTRRTTRSGTLTQPTPTRTSSTSTTSHDMIRPNTSSSLHIVAVITIIPENSPNDSDTVSTNNGGVIDPYPSPARSPYNSGTDSDQSRDANGVVSSQNVPLGVIVGSVFGIIFGGLALFCVLFGINKLHQRKQNSERERRARQLRMGAGTGSSSTIMLARGPEASGSSQTGPGSIHTNEHGEFDRGGILVREANGSPAGSGRGWIRFANQRRPSSSVPVPEVNDHSNTPLMQEWNSASSAHPPKPQFMEHSPSVPSPLRTNRVTGRDSPSAWI